MLIAPAQRGNPQGRVFLWQMDANTKLQFQMSVEDVLSYLPNAYSVFMDRKTKCIGCHLQRFCTLQDVANTYQFPVQDLIGDLEKYVPENTQSSRSHL
jgi:hypothetical protein